MNYDVFHPPHSGRFARRWWCCFNHGERALHYRCCCWSAMHAFKIAKSTPWNSKIYANSNIYAIQLPVHHSSFLAVVTICFYANVEPPDRLKHSSKPSEASFGAQSTSLGSKICSSHLKVFYPAASSFKVRCWKCRPYTFMLMLTLWIDWNAFESHWDSSFGRISTMKCELEASLEHIWRPPLFQNGPRESMTADNSHSYSTAESYRMHSNTIIHWSFRTVIIASLWFSRFSRRNESAVSTLCHYYLFVDTKRQPLWIKSYRSWAPYYSPQHPRTAHSAVAAICYCVLASLALLCRMVGGR